MIVVTHFPLVNSIQWKSVTRTQISRIAVICTHFNTFHFSVKNYCHWKPKTTVSYGDCNKLISLSIYVIITSTLRNNSLNRSKKPCEGSLSFCYPNALDGNPQVRNSKKCPWERGWIWKEGKTSKTLWYLKCSYVKPENIYTTEYVLWLMRFHRPNRFSNIWCVLKE